MKNIKKLVLIIMSLTLLTACRPQGASQTNKETGSNAAGDNSKPVSNVPNGITVNKIDFEELKPQDLKPNLKSIFEAKKQYKGYFSYKDEDGYQYIGFFSGKKNTGGYSIKVLHVEDIEGKAAIVVQESSPKPSSYVTQAITYPYTVIRTKVIAQPIVVKNTSGEEFKDISNSGVSR